MRRDGIGCPRLRLQPRSPFASAPWEERHYGAEAAVYIFAAAAALSATIGAYGAYASSQAQSQALQYNALVSRQQAAYQQELAQLEASLIERQAAGTLSMAQANQELAEQQARAAETAGKVREAAMRRNYEMTQSDVRAAIGKSGVDTTGSPLLVLVENADTVGQQLAINDYQTALDVAGAKASGQMSMAEGQMRADSLRAEAQLRRFGGAAASSAALAQSNLLGMQASNVRSAGMINVGTSLLGGVGATASPFIRYGRYG